MTALGHYNELGYYPCVTFALAKLCGKDKEVRVAEEIELKLVLAPPDQRRFMLHPLLRTAMQRTDQVLDNTYFDTADMALKRYGAALRIRRQGRQRLQTVKLAAKAIGGLSIRPEWEIPYRGRFDFSGIEIDSVRTWLARPELVGALVPLFRTRFRRVTWHLHLETGGEVLVALDRGEVVAGDKTELISEVELELSDSRDVEALQAIAATLAHRVKLTPSSVSKAQRAYRLLAALTPT